MNVTTALRNAVIAEDCFAIVPDFIVENDLLEGTLVQLLPKWTLRKGGIYIVTTQSRLRTKAIQLFLDRVDQELMDVK